METPLEVERLRQVYRGYARRGFGESKWSPTHRGNQALKGERDRRTRTLLQTAGFFPLADKRILDVGCGGGEQLATLASWGASLANLYGVDLMPERIRKAQERFPGITFRLANAETLPFAEGSFDLVSVFTVFTSILDPQMAANISREISRVLRLGGAVLWYDFRWSNPLNRQVRGISRQGIQQLFPGFQPVMETVSLLPPLARRLGPFTDWLYPRLSWFPFLRSHYLGLLQKP